MNESDARFYVDASSIPGAGRGLFARAALPAGERLEVAGVLGPPRLGLGASGEASGAEPGYA
ncbi:MAG: hypothetical protein ABL986_22065 [Vicinamibacterales bacterium]